MILEENYRQFGEPFDPVHLTTRTLSGSNRLGQFYMLAPLLLTTFCGKLSVPPLGALGLGISFPALIIIFAVGLITGKLVVDLRRASYYGLLFGYLGLVQVVREAPFSMSALALVLTVNLMYILTIRGRVPNTIDVLRAFSAVAGFFAVFGILQFSAELALGSTYTFPIENFLPKTLFVQNFHSLNPLSYGSNLYKSNGIFLLEPSYLSQLIAVGMICELYTKRSFLRIVLLSAGILVSYSGTGILVLAVALPAYLVLERRFDILIGIILLISFALLFAAPLRLEVFLNRATEFTDPTSSAYVRFVSWIFLVKSAFSREAVDALLGYGAGNFRNTAVLFASTASELFHAKVLIEYGAIGFLGYLGFLLLNLQTSPVPFPLKLGIFVMIFMGSPFTEPTAGMLLPFLLIPRIPGNQKDLVLESQKPWPIRTVMSA